MSDFMESIDYETGTTIQTFNIIEANENAEGYEVHLDIDLDSGYVLEGVKLNITNDDFAAYETNDIQEVVKYALGFFDQTNGASELNIEEKNMQPKELKNTGTRSQPKQTLKEKYNIDADRAWEDDRL
ncbi:hypothetical protein QNH20_04800 [Neobacillus sp. WH10]|uniref:hypothetical protein n=1 Tax=Neobacillus sp. WH10 TaxID=3047873 RepID=UPI0024C1CBFE|nr:hypothetical protein [Neobacillus sp. WH10]WHY78471.1 hypothetical protein QNH20_04800 [Neobacillus sp. WH10]